MANYSYYHKKESNETLYINKYAVLASPWCSQIHSDINDALSLIREKCTALFLRWYLSVSAHIPVSLFSDVLLLRPNQPHGITATCQSLLRWLTFHETPYLASWPMYRYLHPANKMAPAMSPLIRAFSHGARWQQPDYKLVIYFIHSCDLEKKTNFSIYCCFTADRLDLLSVLFYWIFLPRIVQPTLLWFEKRLCCRLKGMRFTAFGETIFF